MSRLYGDLVLVAQNGDQPRCFMWRGLTYRVREVLATWHLQDRWWERTGSGSSTPAAALETDRHYFRLDCAPDLQCELYYDAASDRWVLERVYD